MITDANLLLSSAQAVTSTAVSTNTIDLGLARDIGDGQDLFVDFEVTTTATAAGSATVNFQIIGSAAANLGTPTILAGSDAIPKATLVAGYRLSLKVPPIVNSTGYRYLGVQYTVSTGPLTAGAFTALVTVDTSDTQTFYASGFSVT